MPLEPHPTDPDKMVYVKREYNLEQPEQDWIERERAVGYREGHMAALSQRAWVGLTDEEIQYCVELKNPEAIVEEVEAKLKEKNT